MSEFAVGDRVRIHKPKDTNFHNRAGVVGVGDGVTPPPHKRVVELDSVNGEPPQQVMVKIKRLRAVPAELPPIASPNKPMMSSHQGFPCSPITLVKVEDPKIVKKFRCISDAMAFLGKSRTEYYPTGYSKPGIAN